MDNGGQKFVKEYKYVLQKRVEAINVMCMSEEDAALHQRLNEANDLLDQVEDSYKGVKLVRRLVSKNDESHEEESIVSDKNILHKVKGVAGGVYEGIKTAAKEIIEEADMAISSGPLTATSYAHLLNAERAALQKNLEFGVTYDVNIGGGKTIRTILFQAVKYHKEVQIPLVMLHGMGGGLPTYHKNFQHLHGDREVYAIDLPGFALSSRIIFVGGAQECTDMFVEIIDKWREMVRLDQFILLGHSFGGYIASAYAVKHPRRVKHLVLLDPWGIRPKEEDETAADQKLWQQSAIEFSQKVKSNPFSILRRTGPLAPLIGSMFSDRIKAAYGDSATSYFVHSITQECLATGERAFSNISGYEYRWAKFPMKPELIKLDDSIPITFIYGKDSPFVSDIGRKISEKRKNVFLPDPIPGAGHHVHAEKPEEVNEIIKTILSRSEVPTSTD